MMNEPVALRVAPITLLSGDFSTGMDSPVIMDSSIEAAAFEDDAIDGNFFTGADAEVVAGLHLFERNVFLCNLASFL